MAIHIGIKGVSIITDQTALKTMIGKIVNDIANAIEMGKFEPKIRIGLTTLGSEHGVLTLVKGAEMIAKKTPDFEVVLIGPKVDSKLEIVEASTEEEMHIKMEELLDSGYINACVTMHYNFPVGVSTVGRVVTPGGGKNMFLATTTGTSSIHRIAAMVKNTVCGIVAAKALGNDHPTVGILNVDGSRQVERALKILKENGYPIHFAESYRSDGGSIMRGNDLLLGIPDIMVQDTLTGNLMMKIFSAFNTGGDYEAVGFGYGPGIGEGYERVVLILSRASGTPVAANAIQYAADLIKGNLKEIIKKEFEAAKKAGLDEILLELTKEPNKEAAPEEKVKAPPSEIVTGSIAGIDIMDLDHAIKVLWKENIYAESGMGCTGPIIMVSEVKLEKALEILAGVGLSSSKGYC
jgi:glycine/sarcosine/betaine reductase complex component C subunit alpha